MPESSGSFGFLKTTRGRVLTLALLAQFGGLFAVSRTEKVPLERSLTEFPTSVGPWTMYQEGTVEKEVMDVLRADDVLTRSYIDKDGKRGANLFVAYFKSQRSGQAPHSPKNCLPGSGWTPSQSDETTIVVPGRAQPIRVNRYVVAKGEDKSLVLYWYQSRDRVIASEYTAKIYLVADAVRYNRTDTALVRVVVPVVQNDVATANSAAEQFVQAFFMPLRHYLPS